MAITIIRKEQQVPGNFAAGAIQELRPVIPGHTGKGGYGNLFYWARAWSEAGGLIDLHPHQGFEIMSVVLKGSLSHYDTLQKQWLDLSAGDVQIIRAGSGVSHAERINPGSEMFQIWFDPDLSKTLGEPASYSDHRQTEFPVTLEGVATIHHIAGGGSPLRMRSEIDLRRIALSAGAWSMPVESGRIVSIFVLQGSAIVGSETLSTGDFARLEGMETFDIQTHEGAEVFCLICPEKPAYRTYLQRLGTP